MAFGEAFYATFWADFISMGLIAAVPFMLFGKAVNIAHSRAHQRAARNMMHQSDRAYGTDFEQNSNW